MRIRVLFIVMALCALITALPASAEPAKKSANNIKITNQSFAAGEKLTYSISWSDIVKAGIAVMEVSEGTGPDGRRALKYVSRTHSVGLVEKFYPVRDTVESLVDADDLSSLQFVLRESHGKRQRERDMLFDRAKETVTVSVNHGAPETFSVPVRVQDALSSLYYVRARKDLTVGQSVLVDVHDNDKTWSVEIQTLGKERIETPAGSFDTVKVKTYPKYEGVFMNKGEIYIWLTDDARRIPVKMQSIISIGSIMATLLEIQGRQDKP